MSKATRLTLDETVTPVNESRYKLREPESSKVINSDEICKLCNSDAIVFDVETSESVCSSCGMVLHDNIETLGPEWRNYSK